MATSDKCVTIGPYFVIKEGRRGEVDSYLSKFVERTKSEDGCLYFGFSLHGNRLHCREGYRDAEGALAHLENVGGLLQELLGSGIVELTELQIHGPEEELAKLREPLKDFNPDYWVLEHGFRR